MDTLSRLELHSPRGEKEMPFLDHLLCITCFACVSCNMTENTLVYFCLIPEWGVFLLKVIEGDKFSTREREIMISA